MMRETFRVAQEPTWVGTPGWTGHVINSGPVDLLLDDTEEVDEGAGVPLHPGHVATFPDKPTLWARASGEGGQLDLVVAGHSWQ